MRVSMTDLYAMGYLTGGGGGRRGGARSRRARYSEIDISEWPI